ncbi:MAG: hypothetical protein JXO44_06720 [Clostridia bacterium]|nr:hypothetical protein [Clostridia bacterium]
MKKSIKILWLACICLILASCAKEEESSIADMMVLYDLEDKASFTIKQYSDSSYLVACFEEDGVSMNPYYYLYNAQTHQSVGIEQHIELIDRVDVIDGRIRLHTEGKNILNGFRDFPCDFSVDESTGLTGHLSIFEPLSNRQIYTLGNYLNQTRLEGIQETDHTIRFGFGATEETILAGGMFCPNITVQGVDEDTISVTIENLVYDKDNLQNGLTNDLISNISVDNVTWTDDLTKTHFLIDLVDVSRYTCDFVEDEDGFYELELIFE